MIKKSPGLLRLPTELFQLIARPLDLQSTLSLMLSCRQAYRLLDGSILKLERVSPKERLRILDFVHRFDRRWRLCHSCETLHRFGGSIVSRDLKYVKGTIWSPTGVFYRVFAAMTTKESGAPSLIFQLRRSDVMQVQLRALRRKGFLHGHGQCAHTLRAQQTCEIGLPALNGVGCARFHVRKEIRGRLQECCGLLRIIASTRVKLSNTETESLERPSIFVEGQLRRIFTLLNINGCIHDNSSKIHECIVEKILDHKRRLGEIDSISLQIPLVKRCSCQSHLEVKIIDKETLEVVHQQSFSEKSVLMNVYGPQITAKNTVRLTSSITKTSYGCVTCGPVNSWSILDTLINFAPMT